jgi:hypothetical protein
VNVSWHLTTRMVSSSKTIRGIQRRNMGGLHRSPSELEHDVHGRGRRYILIPEVYTMNKYTHLHELLHSSNPTSRLQQSVDLSLRDSRSELAMPG